MDREAATLLLAALAGRFYNTQIAPGVLGDAKMDNFEDIGRRLDAELTRLRRYVEEEVAPESRVLPHEPS
jgi:hypothetical protein